MVASLSCKARLKMKNLFGEEQSLDVEKPITGHFKKWRARNNYRIGSKIFCCGNCIRLHSYEYHDKIYHKCLLQGVSASEASDIRLKMVCNLVEKI